MSEPLSAATLTAIEARVAEAVSAAGDSWWHERTDTYGHMVAFADVVPDPETGGETPMQVQEILGQYILNEAVAQFIAESITDIPLLLAEVNRLRTLIGENGETK